MICAGWVHDSSNGLGGSGVVQVQGSSNGSGGWSGESVKAPQGSATVLG